LAKSRNFNGALQAMSNFDGAVEPGTRPPYRESLACCAGLSYSGDLTQ
jgi:hypothetical protein